VLAESAKLISVGNSVVLTIGDKQHLFNIARLSKSLSNGICLCSVMCEHKSYGLNNTEYNITNFNFTGSPAAGLAQVLQGTELTAGVVDFTNTITMKINKKCSRRTALMQFAGLLGGEIEYDGNRINIRKHRGSVNIVPIMDGKTVSDVSVTYDSRSGTAAYNLKLYKKADINVGDNIRIVFSPFGLDAETRIISLTYNPFYQLEVTIEVGQYLPSVSDQLYQIENKVKTAAVSADTALSISEETSKTVAEIPKQIEDTFIQYDREMKLFITEQDFLTEAAADGSYLHIDKLEAGISAYIDTATGKAEVISAASSVYQRIDQMGNYVQTGQLDTSIGQYIDSTAGTAAIISATSTTYQTKDAMSDYVAETTLSTKIGQYVNSTTGKASIVSAVSSTYQRKDAMGNYVAATELNASIGSYIDSTTGKAKIESVVSGKYATTHSVASIKQEVSDNEASISLVVGTNKLVNSSGTVQGSIVITAINNASSATIKADRINLEGYCTFAALKTASSTTVINGSNITTGKIKADYIDVDSMRINKLYTSSTDVAISSNSTSLFIGGGASGTIFCDYSYIFMKATSGIYFTERGTTSSDGVVFDIGADVFRPATTSVSFALGSASYRFSSLYLKGITATDGDIYPVSNAAGDLGTSSYRWGYLYGVNLNISTGSIQLGSATSSKLGFFGTTPVTKQSLGYSSATTSNYTTVINAIITKLKAYGLVS
jgi:hypothetical protein